MPLAIAVTHTTPSEAEQVALFTAMQFGIGTSVRGRPSAAMDGNAKYDLTLLRRIASEGGVAVITFDVGGVRKLGLVRPQQSPRLTSGGLHTVQVNDWVDLPRELRFINTMGKAIRELVGSELAAVIDAAAAHGLGVGKASTSTVVKPIPKSTQPKARMPGKNRPTPPIPEEFRKFRVQPAYTSIFEIYPKETRMYGTEDLYGDWGAEVILMAKDAGNVRNFLPPDQGGLGWPWVHNPARPTNRNLIPLAEQLPGGKLYASFLGPLLRNDDGESGPLVMNDRIRGFIKRLFEWTIASMPRVQTVAVLGQEGWQELAAVAGHERESRRWKARHLSGEPLPAVVAGKQIHLVALNHPARIPAHKLMQQPGWRWILSQHAGGQ